MDQKEIVQFCGNPTYEKFLSLSPAIKKAITQEAEKAISKKENLTIFRKIYEFGIRYMDEEYLKLFDKGLKRIRKEIVSAKNIKDVNESSVTFYIREKEKEKGRKYPIFRIICRISKDLTPSIFYIDEYFSVNRLSSENFEKKQRVTYDRTIAKKRFQHCFHMETLYTIIYKGYESEKKIQETLYKKGKNIPKFLSSHHDRFVSSFGKSMGNYKYNKFLSNVYKNVPMEMQIKNFDIFSEQEAEELKKDQKKEIGKRYSFFYELSEEFTKKLDIEGKLFVAVKKNFNNNDFQRIITFFRDRENKVENPDEKVVILILPEFFVFIINDELEFIHRRQIKKDKEFVNEEFFYPKGTEELDLIDLAYEYSFCSPYKWPK